MYNTTSIPASITSINAKSSIFHFFLEPEHKRDAVFPYLCYKVQAGLVCAITIEVISLPPLALAFTSGWIHFLFRWLHPNGFHGFGIRADGLTILYSSRP